MDRTPVATPNAPAAIGPYSQGIHSGNLLFVSGQLGADPVTGELGPDTVAQTKQALENLTAVLAAAGFSLGEVVKTTIFLADLADFPLVNGVYAGFFPEAPPARSTVQVARLPKDARVEIEAIAAR